MYTAEHCTMYSPSASTPSTVRSVAREQVDRKLANANMAMIKPSDMGLLTEEQKQARDRHQESLRAMLSNHLIEKQEQEMRAHMRSARTACTVPNFDGHQAMPAIIAQDNSIHHTQFTSFTQTEKIEMVDSLTQTMVEMSTQTEEEEGSIVSFTFMSTQIEDRQEIIMVKQSDEMIVPNQR